MNVGPLLAVVQGDIWGYIAAGRYCCRPLSRCCDRLSGELKELSTVCWLCVCPCCLFFRIFYWEREGAGIFIIFQK